MTRKIFASFAVATLVALGGLSAVAKAEQGMPLATEAQGDATTVHPAGIYTDQKDKMG